ncbi:MAG TPA: 50S ribosomal protein L6, partial [Bacillota bacterium]|nr:50S ribosomal protein L6 [Bacillota bacterium]
MSRIGRKPISIPTGVKVELDGHSMIVKGPKGTLSRELHEDMKINIEGDVILVERPSEDKPHKSLHGLTRTLIDNMIVGVTKGYQTDLDIIGTGYKAAVQGKKLVL